jgi:nicotinate-nucleotide adenylyltransferase
MRLGLFGGTFDPVHYGHLLLAEQCREQCALDEVWFIPAGRPPHKGNAKISPAQARAEMLELAVAGDPRFVVSRIEFDRDGPSYTVETLERLKAEGPDRELHLLIGADSLTDLPTWREPRRILELATVVAVNRGDRPLPNLDLIASRIGQPPDLRLRLVEMPGIDLSATDIRRRVKEGHSIRFMTPRAVEAYITAQKMYREG